MSKSLSIFTRHSTLYNAVSVALQLVYAEFMTS